MTILETIEKNGFMNYDEMTTSEKWERLFTEPQHVNPEDVKFKINADIIWYNCHEECYREIMVSYIQMLPLLEKTVDIDAADYVLYMHAFARCEDCSEIVLDQLRRLDKKRKEGATIIVVGKAANAESLLNGEIDNIIFWGDHFTEKLGEMFGFNIKEQYFVYDNALDWLAIWPVDGCLQKCKFCRRTYMDIKFESISLETIKQNLDYYKEFAPEKMATISLRAENLTEYGIDIYGEQRLHELIDLIDSYEEVKNINFPIGVSIGEITPEILESLCRSKKIRKIWMNLEAGSNRLLKFIGKKHTREYAIYVFNKVREAHPDIELSSTVMIGLPTEELTDMYDLASLVVESKPNHILVNYYVCTPRQPLAKYPQSSQSLKEYHLKLFKKVLAQYLKQGVPDDFPKKLSISHERIFKNKSSRSVVKLMENLKRINKTVSFLYGYHQDMIFVAEGAEE